MARGLIVSWMLERGGCRCAFMVNPLRASAGGDKYGPGTAKRSGYEKILVIDRCGQFDAQGFADALDVVHAPTGPK